MPATWNVFYFCFDILFSHSLTEHRGWGRGGGKIIILHSLWVFSPIMACEPSVLLGTCMFFQAKMRLEAIPQCINQCDWGLKMHETNWWVGELGVATFSQSKGVSRNSVQFSFLVAILHKASVNRPWPSVLLFNTSLFFHNPKLHFMFSEKCCIYE